MQAPTDTLLATPDTVRRSVGATADSTAESISDNVSVFSDRLQEWLYDPVVGQIIFVIVGVLVIGTVVRFVRRIVGHRIDSVTTRYRVRKMISFAGWFAIILFVTVVFSDKLGGLTVAFGVAGAGVAFALQEVIASFAGWIAISFRHFYEVGDRVMLGGIRGDVIDIGPLRTTLFEMGEWVDGDLYNGRVVRVANSFVFKEPVFNYSGDFPFLWDEIRIPVRYDSDRVLARHILQEVVDEVIGDYAQAAKATWQQLVQRYLIEDARVDPLVHMTADENWITFNVRYVVDYKSRRGTKDRLFSLILDRFDATNGRVAMATASQEIGIVQVPPFTLETPSRRPTPNGPGGPLNAADDV